MTTPTPKPENPNRYRARDLSCNDFTQHLNFHLGSAFKYIFLHKEDGGREDLEKALWHLRRQRKDEPKQGSQTKAYRKTRGRGSRRPRGRIRGDDGGKAAREHHRRTRRLPDIGHRLVDAIRITAAALKMPYP